MESVVDVDIRGGLSRILLVPANEVGTVQDTDNGVRMELPETVVETTPVEDTAVWRESLQRGDGADRVEHIVEWCVEEGDPALGMIDKAVDGLVAIVERRCGGAWMVGHSSMLGVAYPLRLLSVVRDTGVSRVDDPVWRIRLGCVTDSYSQQIQI